jgi:hypothetical protein
MTAGQACVALPVRQDDTRSWRLIMKVDTPRAIWVTLRPSDRKWLSAGVFGGYLLGLPSGIVFSHLLYQLRPDVFKDLRYWDYAVFMACLALLLWVQRRLMRQARELDRLERNDGAGLP